MATPVEREAREIPIDIVTLLNKLSFLRNSMKRNPEQSVSNKYYTTNSSKYSNNDSDIDEEHNSPTGALGHMEFIVSEDYLEYKRQMAAKKAAEKKIPRSKRQRIVKKETATTEHIENIDQDK